MAKRSKKTQNSQSKLEEFVVVTVAEDLEQAKECESLLKINDIPVVIKEQNKQSTDRATAGSAPTSTKGVAVMVPEDYLDEAHVIIESQDAYDDFYDFALEDEVDNDIDSDPFDDEF